MEHTQLGKEVTIKLPESARELTIEQYQKFLKVEGDETFTMLKALEIFANIPLKVAYAMKADDIMEIGSDIFTMISAKHPLTRRLTFRGREYGFIPNLEEMSFGEYIDLDAYLADMHSLHKTIGVLYRPITKAEGRLLRGRTLQWYGWIFGLSFRCCIRCNAFFLSFKQQVIEEYPDLFTGGGDTDLSASANFSRKWGWYGSVDHLAGGDVARYDSITNLPLRQCLTKLVYDKEKSDVERRMMKLS